MAKKIKVGYFDEEFRKTTIGRTSRSNQTNASYQKQIADRLSIPSEYLESAKAQVEKQAKNKQTATPLNPAKSGTGRAQSLQNPIDFIRSQEFVGYSEAQSMNIVRKSLGNKPTGTKLGM